MGLGRRLPFAEDAAAVSASGSAPNAAPPDSASPAAAAARADPLKSSRRDVPSLMWLPFQTFKVPEANRPVVILRYSEGSLAGRATDERFFAALRMTEGRRRRP